MNVDIFPTLLAAAHTRAPDDVDGANLWPVLLHDVAMDTRSRGWEVYSANVSTLSYSFLSRAGDWRLSNTQGLSHSLFDLIADPSGARDVSPERPDSVSQLSSEFWQEHWRKSLVSVVEHPGDEELQTLYSGFDAMRTPNRHGFAIGLEVGPLPPDLKETAGEKGAVLAGQPGVWELRYFADRGIEWRLGGVLLQDARFDPSRCNAVILTGYFEPKGHLARREPRSEIKLYSSGLLSDVQRDVEFNPVGNDALKSPSFVNYGGKARFANIMLSSFTDSYAPRLLPQFMEFYTSAFREKRLSLADVSQMDSLLCN